VIEAAADQRVGEARFHLLEHRSVAFDEERSAGFFDDLSGAEQGIKVVFGGGHRNLMIA
jgi:hypothetical protein